MMAISSVVGRKYLLGIIVAASAQVRENDQHRNYCQQSPLFSEWSFLETREFVGEYINLYSNAIAQVFLFGDDELALAINLE